ncbi:condensation domain-containing protein [Streptomyces sp. NPDC018833]|uniref:condensation domain-containing protein n=1 Tax=Streptomyces sp. NPDC018833 TaxID=3365053 RepID=UPI00378944AE
MSTTGPLSFGQLSVMRAVQSLPVERWHESNLKTLWVLPTAVPVAAAHRALRTLAVRHESLRTIYDISDPACPRQVVHEDPNTAVDVVDVGRATEQELRGITTDIAHRPFDLWSEYAWRASILTRDGEATHVAMVNHHILADGTAKKVLWDDLMTALTSPETPAESAYSLIRTAEEQRSYEFRAKRLAAERHWEKTLTASIDGGIPPENGDGGTEVIRGCLRSRRSRAAAEQLATRVGLSVSVVLLAAYARAIAEVQGVRSIPMRMASSNRHGHPWVDHVTSMNQWTPLHIGVEDGTSFEDLARPLAMRSLQAYRNGMFDHDAIAAIRSRFPQHIARNESTWAFNHIIAGSSGDPGAFEEFGSEEGELTWEPVFLALGPRFYLRVTDNGNDAWAIRLRARGLGRDAVSEILTTIHKTLLSEAGQ